MKNKLYSILCFAFFVTIGLDVLAVLAFEKNPSHLVTQILIIGCFSMTLIICVLMLLLSDFRKAS